MKKEKRKEKTNNPIPPFHFHHNTHCTHTYNTAYTYRERKREREREKPEGGRGRGRERERKCSYGVNDGRGGHVTATYWAVTRGFGTLRFSSPYGAFQLLHSVSTRIAPPTPQVSSLIIIVYFPIFGFSFLFLCVCIDSDFWIFFFSLLVGMREGVWILCSFFWEVYFTLQFLFLG